MFFDLPTFALLHIAISVIGLLAGLVVLGRLVAGAALDGWTALFLVTTMLTSITGFLFPASAITPAHVVGALSLVALAACLTARYGMKLVRGWRTTEPPFAATQAVILGPFVWLGAAAVRGFRAAR